MGAAQVRLPFGYSFRVYRIPVIFLKKLQKRLYKFLVTMYNTLVYKLINRETRRWREYVPRVRRQRAGDW